MSEYLLILSNLPDDASAQSLAHALVEARLAACVNILSPCRSVYRWKGQVEAADEVPILIKTRKDRYALVERAIRERHPYEVPEIIAWPLTAGLPEYLSWVSEEVVTEK